MCRLCGSSSAGRASRCQRECREFESRFPLQIQNPVKTGFFFITDFLQTLAG